MVKRKMQSRLILYLETHFVDELSHETSSEATNLAAWSTYWNIRLQIFAFGDGRLARFRTTAAHRLCSLRTHGFIRGHCGVPCDKGATEASMELTVGLCA